MKIIMPKEVEASILSMEGNKTVKTNAIKIYAAFYLKSNIKNSNGYFPVPAEYLQTINKRYIKILRHFIETGIIDYYKRAHQDPEDIFNTIYKRHYDTDRGICSKYKFLININVGREIDIDMSSDKSSRWYDVLEHSLIETGFDVKITRDAFGRRVHHSAIRDYKMDFVGYYTIDSVCSQPRLLYLYLKEKGIVDEAYNNIFENDLDFYGEVAHRLKLESRQDAKDLFMFWLNGNGYVPNYGIHTLFPFVSSFLKNLKKGNYKNSGSLLQRIESKIWIDDILNNIPCDFAIPIHDSVIVKEEDVENVLKYCQAKYPQLKFKKEKIK
jgi:hypothetical protein